MLWKIIPRAASLVAKYRCIRLMLGAREKNWPQRKEKREERLQCVTAAVSLTAQLLLMRKISFQLVFAKVGFEALILVCRKKITIWQQNCRFPSFKNREDKAAHVSNPTKSTPKSTAPHQPHSRPPSLVISNLAWRKHLDRVGLTNIYWESLGVLVAPHRQEFG